MFTSWTQAREAKRSPLNIGRSTERNRRKQAQGAVNREARATLQREKSGADTNKRDEIQRRLSKVGK